MKKFMSGLLIGGVLATSVTAFAATTVNMQAVYSVKRLVVDGVDTGKGNVAFVSNGTTYVPLRTVSDALGHDISWDSNTKTIYINKANSNVGNGEPTDLPQSGGNVNNTPAPAPAPTPAPTPAPAPNNGSKLIGMEAAKSAAIKAVGGGRIIASKADIYDMDDLPKYEFKISHNNRIYEVDVNALTGAVVDFDLD